MHCYKDYGGISYWVGDGFCDDINNNEACDYDDGDCCGLSMKKNFCVQCICKGKSNSFKKCFYSTYYTSDLFMLRTLTSQSFKLMKAIESIIIFL